MIQNDFAALMGDIYGNIAKKYETVVKAIVNDSEFDLIDFPQFAKKFEVEPFYSLLPPALAEKLNLEKE